MLKKEILDDMEKAQHDSKPVTLDQSSVGRLSRMDAIQMQEMALTTKHRREHMLQGIEKALLRIEKNEFGYCLRCKEEIDFKRLDIQPIVQLCVQCVS